MHFNSHTNVTGQHAFLSPSNYHWINYDDDKLARTFVASMAAKRGSELHALAHQLIRLGVKLPSSSKTLNAYVNDGIGYKMTPEQPLYYSPNSFGTADCISFKRNFLRVHDLKTGVTPASETQLKVYAALFCLEYRYKPFEIKTEVRIYQNDEIHAFEVDPDETFHIMDRIVYFDKLITQMRTEAES